jgi:hypothetical protein
MAIARETRVRLFFSQCSVTPRKLRFFELQISAADKQTTLTVDKDEIKFSLNELN